MGAILFVDKDLMTHKKDSTSGVLAATECVQCFIYFPTKRFKRGWWEWVYYQVISLYEVINISVEFRRLR